MGRQEDTEAVAKRVSSLSNTHLTSTSMNPIRGTENAEPTSYSPNQTDSDSTQEWTFNVTDVSAIERYLRPLIAAFQQRHDTGTLSEDDAELDELYTRWQAAERELGDAALDAAIGIFPGKELDEGSKAQAGLTLTEGGRGCFEAEMVFFRAMLERFEGLEKQRLAVSREIEDSWRSFEKGDEAGFMEENIGFNRLEQEDVEEMADAEMGLEQRPVVEDAKKGDVIE